MNYFKVLESDYIVGTGTTENDIPNSISESDYNNIRSLFINRPTAQDGFTYKLKADTLEWELVELPEPIETDDDATESDYIDALQDLGVTLDA